MSGRRGFLAVVGGSRVSGAIMRRAEAKPTLILPPSAPLIETASVGGIYPLLAAEQSQMHAFIRIKGAMPDDLFLDWLEGGLRMAKSAEPGGRLYRALQAEGRT